MLSLNSQYVYSWILHGDLTITVDNHDTLFKLNFRKSNSRYRLHARVDFSRLLGIALFLSYNRISREQPTCTFTLETFDILISAHYDSSLSLSVSFFLFGGSNEYIYFRRFTSKATLTFVDNWFFLWWRSLSWAPGDSRSRFYEKRIDHRVQSALDVSSIDARITRRVTRRGKRHPGGGRGGNATFRYCSKLLPKATSRCGRIEIEYFPAYISSNLR